MPRSLKHDVETDQKPGEVDPSTLALERILSIVEFRPSEGEEIFLSYSLGLEHGPGIDRSGDRPPSMRKFWDLANPFGDSTDPDEQRIGTWFIDKEGAEAEILDCAATVQAITDARLKSETTKVQELERKLAVLDKTARAARQGGVHDERFRLDYPEYAQRIIGQQGCGDLTMNQWYVAYLCSRLTKNKPQLIWLYDEAITKRTYNCLVKWKDKRVTIEEGVRFTPDGRVLLSNEFRQDEVEFVVSGKQVIREGKPVKLPSIAHQFADIRHLVHLPDLNPKDPATGKRLRYYYGKEFGDSVWLSEKQLLEDWNLKRAAVAGPVILNRLYGGMGASVEQIAAAMDSVKYEDTPDPAPVEAEHWRFVPWDDNQFEVHLRHNRYPWGMVGVDPVRGSVVLFACNGRQGQTGYTLAKACETFLDVTREKGIELSSVLLMDEGNDVFQKVFLGNHLQIRVPLRRRQVRGSFIFAQTK